MRRLLLAIETLLQLAASASLTFGLFTAPMALTLVVVSLPELEIVDDTPFREPVTVDLEALLGDGGHDAHDAKTGKGEPEVAAAAPAAPNPASRPVPASTTLRSKKPTPFGDVALVTGPALPVKGVRTSTRPPVKKPAPRAAAEPCPEPPPEIRLLDDGTIEVERAIIDDYAGSLAKLNSLGWVRRHLDDGGKPDGFQVGGFGCKGLLWHAGLRRGDVVNAVEGRKVANLFQAIRAYGQLRHREVLRLELTRKDGSHVELAYHLIGDGHREKVDVPKEEKEKQRKALVAERKARRDAKKAAVADAEPEPKVKRGR